MSSSCQEPTFHQLWFVNFPFFPKEEEKALMSSQELTFHQLRFVTIQDDQALQVQL